MKTFEAASKLKLTSGTPQIVVQEVTDPEYQYLGHFETTEGSPIPVYVDAEGTCYQIEGVQGNVAPVVDVTVRMKAEKHPKFKEKKELARKSVAQKEYASSLKKKIDRIKERLGSNVKVELKGTKIEITLKKDRPEFPKFYLEPQLKWNKTKKE